MKRDTAVMVMFVAVWLIPMILIMGWVTLKWLTTSRTYLECMGYHE